MTNRNKTVKFLLATTAAIALGSASPALAQDMWVSVEGGKSAMTTSNSYYSNEIDGYSGSYYDTGTISGTGNNLAFEAGINFADSPYSLSIGARSSSEGHTYYYDQYVDEVSFTTLDFEVGRDVSLGGSATGRLTLGVRSASVNASGTNYYGYYNGSTEFGGVGPRIALEASIPVMDRVSFDVEAGAAILFGTTSNNTNGYYGTSYTDSGSTTVTNLDFSAAVSYLIGSKSKVSLGYRYEKFDGIDGYNYASGYVDSVEDQGAFLKFTTRF
ncbi:hypothetical protein A9Q96_00460 [Rhodobacterales bacterium 52_120_T64]|nr:hypothetical protein A9Q96_00460 [Rhodobacterales bacterium 52_120_T64]